MKIKDGFVKREVAGKTVAVAVGARASDFRGMITLNGTAAFLWTALEKDTTEKELVSLLTDAYEVPAPKAEQDVAAFVKGLREAGLLDE